ncbi:unnamed protein product [Paramecium octaurelia]|uniref:Uncharacterized protein n=1 Tax=Paramecium octaurelia TaxID=43137 RepID=A0A8S1SJQ4_PAROT|nr:unnamed protein product [Paramecium octaurelia]
MLPYQRELESSNIDTTIIRIGQYSKLNLIKQNDYITQLIEEYSDEKSLLIYQIEELKIQQQLVEEQFFQTALFADLTQLMNKELLEKFQIQIQQLQQKYQQKVKDLGLQQEIVKTEGQLQNKPIEDVLSQVENFSKVMEELRNKETKN